MAKKAVKVTLWVVVAIVAILTAISFYAGSYMVGYGLTPDIQRNLDTLWVTEMHYPGLHDWADSMFTNGLMKETTAIDDEGYEVHAYYAEAEENVGKTAVIIHGYTSNPFSMMMLARMYRDSLGYNVLLPHLNYHLNSEGNAVQMGWKDRLDIEQIWIPTAHEIFQDSLMIVTGISMGGATTMMVSGDELPDYVKGFVEDCGYSSVWDEFSGELKNQFGLPTFPILNCASLVCRMKYGWDFKTASSVNQLAKCEKPMLFIHGDNDTFVPTAHIYKNYDAKVNGYKEMWLVPDTKHGESFRNFPDEYTARVRAFLKEHIE